MDYLICHYHEIGLKGKNRRFFEERLVMNIKKALEKGWFYSVRRISGRILVKLTKEGQEREAEVVAALKDVFGLANFSLAVRVEPNMGEIQEGALEILRKKKFKSFKVATQRADKEFPLTSQEVNERAGEYILKQFKTKNQKPKTTAKKPKVKVDLEKPDVPVFIEIVEKDAFLYTEKIPGPGGLPVNTGGRVVVLLSGGIDSPVAAYFVAKRGVSLVFVHFHAYPFTKKASIDKAEKIVELFKRYQFVSRLYLVPFAELQKEIVLKTPAKLRMILYRRAMAKISEEIAKRERARALVTGESIGQVASQTLENIRVIDEAVALPIFRPLIGFNKEEIIQKARAIGTYVISILPHEDCCSRFLPAYPETRARISEVKQAEKKLPLGNLIEQALKKSELKKI